MIPVGVVYVVASGIIGVWFAGLMKPQPTAITIRTMVTFTTTMMAFTNADSFVPRISSADSRPRMMMAGMFMIPVRSLPAIVSKGEWDHWYGIRKPNQSSTRFRYSLHA